MKPFIKNVFYLLLPMIMLQGCIKEKLADCDFTLVLNFEQTSNCLPASPYPADLNRIDIFAFDENGLFVNQFTVLNPHTGQDFKVPVTLPGGVFTLVAWAGFAEEQLNLNHFIKGLSNINEVYMASFIAKPHSNGTSPHTLYYGIKSNITVLANSTTPEVITLLQKTKPIHINLGGEGLNPTDDFQISISHNATYYRFDNVGVRLNPGDDKTIAPLIADLSTTSYKASTHIIWPLDDNNSPLLIIQNLTTNNKSFSLSLADLLSRMPQTDFDCEPAIDIDIYYISDVQIEVRINGWKVISFDTEI